MLWRQIELNGGRLQEMAAHTEADRRRIYSGWVSQARKQFLSENMAPFGKAMLKWVLSCGAMVLKKTRSFDMSKVLPLERWKKMPIAEREAFSDIFRGGRFWLRRYRHFKSQETKARYWSGEVKSQADKAQSQTADTKEASTSCNSSKEVAEKATPGFERCARAPSWQASKAIQTKQIEGFIYSLSKIIRAGQTV